MQYTNGSHDNIKVVLDKKNRDMSSLEKIIVKISIIIGILITIVLIAKPISIVVVVTIRDINYAKYRDSEYVEKDILEYLEERYSENFVIESCVVSRYDSDIRPEYGTIEAYVYPLEHYDEKHKFRVQGDKNIFGIVDYYDTYTDIKLIEEYETLIDPILGECYDEYKFYVSFPTTWLNKNLPVDTKVEDFNEMEQHTDYYSRPTLVIYLPPSEPRSGMYDVSKKLSEGNYVGYVSYKWFYKDEGYDRKGRNDWGDNDGYNFEVYSNIICEDGKILK